MDRRNFLKMLLMIVWLSADEVHGVSFGLNKAYHTPEKVCRLLSVLSGYQVLQALRVFSPFYADFRKEIIIGEDVFINTCCHFQDHDGVVVGNGAQSFRIWYLPYYLRRVLL